MYLVNNILLCNAKVFQYDPGDLRGNGTYHLCASDENRDGLDARYKYYPGQIKIIQMVYKGI